jgi:hypothetical protein
MIYKLIFYFFKNLITQKDVALCEVVKVYKRNFTKLSFSNHLKYFLNPLNKTKISYVIFLMLLDVLHIHNEIYFRFCQMFP